MADKSASPDAPTTKQTLIVALAVGVVAGGAGAALGYMIGGQTVPHDGGTTAEAHRASSVSQEHGARTSQECSTVDHDAKAHGDKNTHDTSTTGTHSKQNATKLPPCPHDLSLKLTVRELTPIVTNLAEPGNNWIRLQSAIVFNPDELPHPDKMIAELTSDITGYLRTLSLSNLEGADGLRRLQEELSERASIRSEGKIREYIVETMVVQ